MWMIRMAWKNMWRNRSRTAITMAAVFFAVLLSVVTGCLYKGVFDNLIKNVVSFYSGYIQVHRRGYWDEQVLDNSMHLKTEVMRRIGQQSRVTAVAPRLESFALVASENLTRGCQVTGIDPGREQQITQLKSRLIRGEYLQENDRSVLLSEGLAKKLNLDRNDTLYLIGQGYHGTTAAGKYPVSGILRFGSPQLNENLLFMPLPLAQEMYAAEQLVTSYVIGIQSAGQTQAIAADLRNWLGRDYEVMTWGEMMPDILQHMKTDMGNMKIIQLVLYLLICFGVFGTLVMMMVERKYEMGMLVAIGMKKTLLMGLLLIESVLTVTAGCLGGLLVSIPAVWYLQEFPIRFSGKVAEIYERFGFEAIWPATADPAIFISQGLIVLMIGLALSFYSVYKVARLKPVLAMRR